LQHYKPNALAAAHIAYTPLSTRWVTTSSTTYLASPPPPPSASSFFLISRAKNRSIQV